MSKAFPESRKAEDWIETGLTLRDYFAGQALAGMGQWCPGLDPYWPNPEEVCRRKAEWAYRQADAMLEARKSNER